MLLCSVLAGACVVFVCDAGPRCRSPLVEGGFLAAMGCDCVLAPAVDSVFGLLFVVLGALSTALPMLEMPNECVDVRFSSDGARLCAVVLLVPDVVAAALFGTDTLFAAPAPLLELFLLGVLMRALAVVAVDDACTVILDITVCAAVELTVLVAVALVVATFVADTRSLAVEATETGVMFIDASVVDTKTLSLCADVMTEVLTLVGGMVGIVPQCMGRVTGGLSLVTPRPRPRVANGDVIMLTVVGVELPAALVSAAVDGSVCCEGDASPIGAPMVLSA